jgi:hypothetical protein
MAEAGTRYPLARHSEEGGLMRWQTAALQPDYCAFSDLSAIGPSRTGIFRRSQSTFAQRVKLDEFPANRVSPTTHHRRFPTCGRGSGVGRGRAVGRGLGVTLGVDVAVALGVGLVVGVGVTDGVGVTEGVEVGVAVGVADGVTVAVGVGVGVPPGTRNL